VQLKWPNDLRVDGSKLGGILSELAVDGEARYTLVVGIGINLHLADGARTAIGQAAVALDELLPARVVASERGGLDRSSCRPP
jgi:BirA family transcriptional regulator, biotin operon repressor / biotin---[acetyl-CoA-carboxylase] ligase